MTINNKLNLLLIIYTLSVVFFQPLAITIHVAMIIFIAIRREWRACTYGIVLFAILSCVILRIHHYGLAKDDWSNTSILVFSVLTNLIWFVAIIKILKIQLSEEN